ncbi:hypothetical protein BDV97DRAFT_173024 [Delphinella strobiligena]|nr:hypothetical protein BDV97DRAFT_173024 [Delphinella strobiligena]
MPVEEVAARPKRPSLVHRHSSATEKTSSNASQSPTDSQGTARPGAGYHKPHKHVVHHGRMGRNPSFHRALSKVKIQTVAQVPAQAIEEDDTPTTPKAKAHRRTHSVGGPASASLLAPPSPGPRPGGMKRNNTSLALPRTGSTTALKKNHSSSQLQRLGSSRNVGHAHKPARQERPDMRRANTQPYKRHKSPAPVADFRRPSVHFNVGNDDDDDDDQEMEGVDDVWTEESASASPNTTRDNTRNNTRQNSIVLDPLQNPYAHNPQSRPEEKPPDTDDDEVAVVTEPPPAPGLGQSSLRTHTHDFATQEMADNAAHLHLLQRQREEAEAKAQAQEHDETPDEDDEDTEHAEEEDDDDDDDDDEEDDEEKQVSQVQNQQQEHQQRIQQVSHSQSQQHHDQQQHHHSNHQSRPLDTELISKRLLEKNAPAPPRVSSVSAMANAASADPKSLSQSHNGNLAPTGANNTPVVSRFVGPDDGTDSKEATPRNQSSFLRTHQRSSSISHTASQQDGNLQRNKSAPNFQAQDRPVTSPTTPSGAQTPDTLLNNSRTQQKLWLQRGLSNIEASSHPHLPSLKLPTGRAQAMRTTNKATQFDFVDKEYAVVRRFHNTLFQGVERIRLLNGGTLPGKPKKVIAQTPSTATLNGNKRPATAVPPTAKTTRHARSASTATTATTRSHRESAGQRARVSFHTGTSPGSGRQSPVDDEDDEDDEDDRDRYGDERPPTAAEIARRMWETDATISIEA